MRACVRVCVYIFIDHPLNVFNNCLKKKERKEGREKERKKERTYNILIKTALFSNFESLFLSNRKMQTENR